jgi:hypothetical protein
VGIAELHQVDQGKRFQWHNDGKQNCWAPGNKLIIVSLVYHRIYRNLQWPLTFGFAFGKAAVEMVWLNRWKCESGGVQNLVCCSDRKDVHGFLSSCRVCLEWACGEWLVNIFFLPERVCIVTIWASVGWCSCVLLCCMHACIFVLIWAKTRSWCGWDAVVICSCIVAARWAHMVSACWPMPHGLQI